MVATDISSLVTEVLLRHVISGLETVKSNYGGEHPRSKYHLERHTFCEKIAAEIGACTVHRLSTNFDFYKSHDYIDTSKSPKIFIETFLEKSCSRLKQLTSFRIRVNPIDKNIISTCQLNMRNLQEFCYREYCENFILGTLAIHCKYLKHLDVRDSKQVTDNSVPFIVSFKELTSLDINRTDISQNGITQIIEDLHAILPSDSPPSQKKFKTHDVIAGNIISHLGTSLISPQVENLSSKLPFLTSLHMTISEDIALHPLSELRSLTALGIGFDASSIAFFTLEFDILRNILDLLGRKLQKLSLSEVYGIDLDWLSCKCRYLKYLNLELNHCRDRMNSAILLWRQKEVYPVPKYSDEGRNFLDYLPPFVKSLILSGDLWRSDFLLSTLFKLVKAGRIKEIIVNNFAMNIIGTHVYVTSMEGVRFFVEMLNFYPVLKSVFESGRRLDLRLEL